MSPRALALSATPAAAQEVFAGAYVHAVDTPFTLDTGEGGADLELGYRFGKLRSWRFDRQTFALPVRFAQHAGRHQLRRRRG